MIAIIIHHGDRYYPAELIGTTNRALLPPGQIWLSARQHRKRFRRLLDEQYVFDQSWIPNSFKSAKQARRFARRRFGAGNLDMGKWRAKLQRGQRRLEAGHLVMVTR
jgi:hypothetical protein